MLTSAGFWYRHCYRALVPEDGGQQQQQRPAGPAQVRQPGGGGGEQRRRRPGAGDRALGGLRHGPAQGQAQDQVAQAADLAEM